MNILKGKNVNLALMLFVVTLFEVTCLFTLLSKAEEQYKMNIIITMGVYILVQFAYFFGSKIILKRKSFEVEFCTGCFSVLRTDVFKKIKGFDPQYFLYFEDADITMEAKKHGKAYYNADATVVHLWHRETAKSFKPFMLQLRSMFVYMKKWGYKL